jgi:two-component system, NarL family, nitrate/nitrite response regulator NarL
MTAMEQRILAGPMRILIVDDETLFREGLRALMESLDPGAQIRVVGDIDSAVDVVQLERPDVVLLDLNLPPLSGTEGLDQLRAKVPEAMICAFSASRDPQLMRECIEHGASGFIVKASTPQTLMSALGIVLAGGVNLPKEALSKSAPRRAESAPTPGGTSNSSRFSLTARQQDMLTLVALGHHTGPIAAKLCISEATVREHLDAVFRALGVRTPFMWLCSLGSFR